VKQKYEYTNILLDDGQRRPKCNKIYINVIIQKENIWAKECWSDGRMEKDV
jgi:hypothetical protein